MKTKFKDLNPIRYIETRDNIFIVKTLSKIDYDRFSNV